MISLELACSTRLDQDREGSRGLGLRWLSVEPPQAVDTDWIFRYSRYRKPRETNKNFLSLGMAVSVPSSSLLATAKGRQQAYA